MRAAALAAGDYRLGEPGGSYDPGDNGPGGAYPSWPASYDPSRRTPSGMGALEIAAIILLLVGGFLAGIGWIVGAILLWISPRWRLSDKLLGTLIWPGGLAGALIVLSGGAFLAVGTASTACYSYGINNQTNSLQCSNAGEGSLAGSR